MRKRAAKKRVLLPDPKFNDQLVTRFVNNLMWSGKKSVAFKVFYDALELVEEKKGEEEERAQTGAHRRGTRGARPGERGSRAREEGTRGGGQG